MPIYEYRCEKCGHQFEAIQKIADAPLLDCPACHQPTLAKIVSAPVFRLKGGGWYETDFKTGDKKKNLADSGNSAASTTSASANKSTAATPSSATPTSAA